MKHSRRIASMGIITVFLLLIFDSKTAFVGASQGVQLCVATVIPSLFPFFLICSMLTASLGNMTLPFLRPLGKRLGIAQGAESLFLIGLLGGYPVGAQSIAQACKAGTLSKQDGERMLAFSSNAGPAFLFGIGSGLFTKKWICWLLWGIHILAALVVALLTCNGQRSRSSSSFAENSLSLSACMQRSVKSMAIVCGWIIVFRTLICFCRRWFLWLLPRNCQLLVTGLLELTNGTCELKAIACEGLRMQLFSLFLGFGGSCVLLQTHSVLAGSGLRGNAYFPGKILQAAISYLLCAGIQPFLSAELRHTPPLAALLTATFLCLMGAVYHLKSKKGSSISFKVGV